MHDFVTTNSLFRHESAISTTNNLTVMSIAAAPAISIRSTRTVITIGSTLLELLKRMESHTAAFVANAGDKLESNETVCSRAVDVYATVVHWCCVWESFCVRELIPILNQSKTSGLSLH